MMLTVNDFKRWLKMTETDINSGTGAGLMAFLDYLVEKGYGSQSAVGPWKSASRQILQAMEGEDYEGKDVSAIKPDEYLDRFENRGRGKYKAESLRAYRSRFRNAINSYRAFLEDGSIPKFRGSRQGASKETPAKHAPADTGRSADPAKPSPRLVEYPFPLRSGELAYVRLPARLEKADAERLAAFVRTLVFEPQRELVSGGSDDSESVDG